MGCRVIFVVTMALSLSLLKLQQWLSENQIKTIYIDPGSPWQNGYIESFHSRFRDECLGREMLLNLREARVVISDWRLHYNQERPHSKLGYRSPNEFIYLRVCLKNRIERLAEYMRV